MQITAALERRGAVASLSLTVAIETAGPRGGDHVRQPSQPASRSASAGVVTFAYFTCQPRCALKDGAKENQSFRALDVGVESAENGLFLANVTKPHA